MIFLLLLLAIAASAQSGQRTVERVIDGDTLVLDGGEVVRLVGLDAPEVAGRRGIAQCFAIQSAA